MNLAFALILAQAVTIDIDAAADRHRINPNIYGVNFASQQELAELNVPLNRSGGNTMTRYNWQQNCANHAADWFFESLEHGSATAGEETDAFIAATKNAGAQPMITIPTIGWVAKLGPQRQRLASFSIAKYGAQQANDWQWFPDAGNGKRPDGTLITGNDPHDANTPVDENFIGQWVEHLATKWGPASSTGVRYYMLDNEPSLWQETHRDVKPAGATMDEMLERIVTYGSKVKSVDPNAIVAAPEEWGWLGYHLSGYDFQWHGEHGQWWNGPDRMAHGGWDFIPWLLANLHDHEFRTGRRVVDLLTVHYYPQGGEFSSNVTAEMQLRRNRSTRSLWDAAYTDETWIADEINLIPLLRTWVDRYYPGAPIGITEYSWGADEHMNGATAQADVLGIFGRERLDLATRWVVPDSGTPVFRAFQMYRNYDGAKSAFGDISVRATAPSPDDVSAFAAIRSSDRALTVMLINKQPSSTASVTPAIANYTPTGNAQRWQLTSSGIARVADVAANTTLTLPAQSVTLLVFPGTTDVTDPAIAMNEPVLNANGLWSFSGTASDPSGIASVKVHVSGTVPLDGTATGTTSWSFGPIGLSNGVNHITVTAFDAAGNPKSVSTRVVHGVMAPPPAPPKSGKRRAVR